MTEKMHSLHLRTTPAPLGGSGSGGGATGVSGLGGVGGLTSSLIGNPTLISSTLSAQLQQDALRLTPAVDIDIEHPPPTSAISTRSSPSMFPVPVLGAASMSSSMMENGSHEHQFAVSGGSGGGGAPATRSMTSSAQLNFQLLPLLEHHNGGQSSVDSHHLVAHDIGTPMAAMSNSQISSMMSNESLLATSATASATGSATAAKPIIAQSVAGGVSSPIKIYIKYNGFI